MSKSERECPFCFSMLAEGEECGCPDSVAQREYEAQEKRSRAAVEGTQVEIHLVKKPGTDYFHIAIDGNDSAALLCGIGMLIRKVAGMMGQTPDRVFAVLATVLFAPDAEQGKGGGKA